MFKKILDKIKDIDKKWLIIGGIGIILLIIIILIIVGSDNGIFFVKEDDGERFAKEYNKLNNTLDDNGNRYLEIDIPINNPMKYVDDDDIIDKIENLGDAVVYFGYAEECHYCRIAASILIEAAIEKELEEIYYLDIEKQSNKYNKLYETLGENLTEENNGKKTIEAPLVIFIVNGEIASYNKGTLFSHKNPYYPMSDSMRNGLKGIYNSGINDVLESLEIKESFEKKENTENS